MNDITDALNERIQHTETELTQLDADLEQLQRRKSVLARYLDAARSLLDMEQQRSADGGNSVENPTGKRFVGKSLTQAANELLLEANRPMHVKDIWKGIIEGGITSRAKTPYETLTSRLARDKRFFNIGHRTFKLTAWDEVQVGLGGNGRDAGH